MLCLIQSMGGGNQPLAAAFGWQGEGELSLARKLFSRHSLPAGKKSCFSGLKGIELQGVIILTGPKRPDFISGGIAV